MFSHKIRESVAAAMLAIVLSAASIGAAVGPARAIETGPSLSTPVQVA